LPQSPERRRGGPLYASCASGAAEQTVQRRFRLAPEHVVDVFVYVVVLNLANEYVPTVITETFTVSLLTAVLLKVVLEGVVWVKDRLKGRFKAATTGEPCGCATTAYSAHRESAVNETLTDCA
jgi:hypothetical protein